MKEQNRIFSERLKIAISEREQRTGEKLSQKKIADDLQCARKTINEYLNNRALPDKEMQKRLSNYFHVDIEWLLGETDYKSSIEVWIKNNPDIASETKIYGSMFTSVEKYINYKTGDFNPDVYLTDFEKQIENQIINTYQSSVDKVNHMSDKEKAKIIKKLLSE